MKAGDFGFHIFRSPGREMPAECKDCPFKARREGTPYLSAKRYEDIEFNVSMGQPFFCHKTVDYSREDVPSWGPDYKLCAGAINAVKALEEELDQKD